MDYNNYKYLPHLPASYGEFHIVPKYNIVYIPVDCQRQRVINQYCAISDISSKLDITTFSSWKNILKLKKKIVFFYYLIKEKHYYNMFTVVIKDLSKFTKLYDVYLLSSCSVVLHAGLIYYNFIINKCKTLFYK